MADDLFGLCPYTTAQRLLSGKWTLLILYFISERPQRFCELQRQLPDLTQSTLSRQLHTMEANGLLIRTVYSQIPPKVEYSLSEMGEAFRPALLAIGLWGEAYIRRLRAEDKPHLSESKD